jgi:hypothetical protein
MKVLLLALLFSTLSAAAEPKPKYGPASKPVAVPLFSSSEYFRSRAHPAPDYWNLAGYYVPQFNGAACSAASVAMVLNAARTRLVRSADDQVVLQPEMLEKVSVEQWKERLSRAGFQGSHGMDLDRLGKATEAAFRAYGFPEASVEVRHMDDRSPATKKSLVSLLKKNEASADDFIIANFDQKVFTDDTQVGHVSPVGAYDSEKERVLIFDPDREYYEPYWISVSDFLAGMATPDQSVGKNRGLIYVKVKKSGNPKSKTPDSHP